jgi:hypothetical protein
MVVRRLYGPKRWIWIQKVGTHIIRVAQQAADLDVPLVPAACPIRWSTELDAREPLR